MLIGDFSRAVSILRRLKALGVRIAMDDFGTGYSSLSYLQSFPFDKIKIDQAFISNLGAQPAVRHHHSRGDRPGARPRPAGAGRRRRDREPARFLAKESCDEIQGYLIGRPLPIEDYAALTGDPAAEAPRKARVGAAAG